MNNLTRFEVDAKIAASEARIDARHANLEACIRTGFAEMRAEIAKLAGDTTTGIAKLAGDMNTDMAKLAGDVTTDMAKMRTEMHKQFADLIKWAIGLAVTIVGMTVGLVTYIDKSSVTSMRPVVQPAPVIILVPGASVTSPAPAPDMKK